MSRSMVLMGHCEPAFGSRFHLGDRPYAADTGMTLENFWSSADNPNDGRSAYEVPAPKVGYSTYGAQRMPMAANVVRRNPRVGWAPGTADFVTLGAGEMRPDPNVGPDAFLKEWQGGTVWIHKGDWGWTGASKERPWVSDKAVKLRIEDAYGEVGNVTVMFAPIGTPPGQSKSIPTERYPGGTNLFLLRDIAGTGSWSKPGMFGKTLAKVGTGALLLGAVAAGWFLLKPGGMLTATRRQNPTHYKPYTLRGKSGWMPVERYVFKSSERARKAAARLRALRSE